MNRNILIAASLLVAAGVGATVVKLTARRPEWTTSSQAARAEFRKGLEARDKLYYDEARLHFSKAAELDPNFLMAKYFIVASTESSSDDPSVDKTLADLQRAGASRLTDRERFLLDYTIANRKKDTATAEQILHAYAAKHPDDPYVLERETAVATQRQEWPEAHRLLTRSIEASPNRVLAYNQLGYLEMGQGRFADAEKMFETYRYIAPDQANPHDSLGELYILLGRYDDARRELEAALTIKPDFCASYEHLLRIALLEGKPDEADREAARINRSVPCAASIGKEMSCLAAVWRPLLAGDWEGVWRAEQSSCADPDQDTLRIWALLRTGRRAEADAFAKKQQEKLAAIPASDPGRGYMEAFVAHIEGARFLADGEPGKAAERFRFADRQLSYRELPMGLVKLFNRFMLAQALQAGGVHDEAATVLAAARAVNASFIDRLSVLMPAPAAS